ncbi:MAG: VWA domain-containing protein [Acidobacteria bacterium]|nr:VWA domain-containing protein [Acidobacteriota bacterium]
MTSMARRHVRVMVVAFAACVCLAMAAGRAAQTPPQKPVTPAVPAPPSQGGQAPQQAPQQPTFRTGISFVRVDVIVSDKDGRPVTDLAQADFEVVEDGKPQRVETFKLVEITGIPQPGDQPPREIRTAYDEELEAARDDVRLFVIFLDDYHVRRGASMSVREPLVRFINNQVGPSDLVGLMYPLTPVSAIRFSRDRSLLAGAVRKFEGRKFDYTPRNEAEERYSMYPVETVERIRNQVTLSALEGLVIHLGSMREGRKAVILVSEGFSNYIPPQLRDPVAAFPGLGNPNRNRPLAGEGDPNEERAQFLGSADLNNELRDVYDAANKNNTAIYALDPRGLAPFEYDINQGIGLQTDRKMLDSTLDSLRVLSDNTDGRAIVNRNDLDGGLKQLVRDSSAYYLLGYNSARAPADGKFHEIKVRVRRPGVQVRARRGYWALTAEDLKRATAPPKPDLPPAVNKALTSIIEPPRGRFIRSWVGTARGSDGRTHVSFVWEPLPSVPGSPRFQPLQIMLVATGADNKPYFRGLVPKEAPPIVSDRVQDAQENQNALVPVPREPSRIEFDAVPGPLQFRISVHGNAGDIIDTEVREVTVPDFTVPQVAIGTPAVFRAANAREFQMLRRNANAVPTAGREFRRTDRLLIRFEVYGPGESNPAVTCRVLNRTGGARSELPVPPPVNGTLYEIDLPLAGLTSGEYLVEIRAKGADTDVTELVALRIVA